MPADDLDVTSPSRRGRRLSPRHWVALVLVVLAAIFIAQNRDQPRIHILWITVQAPMWVILTVMLAVGILVGLLLRRRRRS
jgi:putative membrane protein